MNENTSQTENPGTDQWAFQNIWADSFKKMLQLGMTFSPESTPPEFVRQMRASIFQAMAQSWDEFLRSPQFLDGMKQWMESAIAFRQMTNDTLTRLHQDIQTPASNDIDALLVAIRRGEQRILDRIDNIEASIKAMAKPAARPNGATARKASPTRAKAAKASKGRAS